MSTMYLLKFGLVLPNIKLCVIPADRYIHNSLPDQIHLDRFGFQSRTVTAGMKKIRAVFASCVDAGYTTEQLTSVIESVFTNTKKSIEKAAAEGK